MKIRLSQFLTDEKMEASIRGDVITINDEVIDLSAIPDGYRLPGSAVDNKWFSANGYVERINGHFEFTLVFPVKWDSPESVRAPEEPIVLDVKSGKVKFPDVEPLRDV